MKKIDFSEFNKPKYFPAWLCSGDTLRLAELPDAQLEEIEANIIKMADQFDIDNASGVELDRIGKILCEPRNGNIDRIYRIYLKLKSMLNTADGTVEDIIRFVKFFFSSETVHLVPNYPAGLRILHDGFNDTVDFNRILKQMVGAGVAYDTRELFNMTDEMPIEEIDWKRVHRTEKEYFPRNMVFRNGRVLRDGVTVLPTCVVQLLRNDMYTRDGFLTKREGVVRVVADSPVNIPILRNSGIFDLFSLVYAKSFDDRWKSLLFRNGAVCHDGSERRNGSAVSSINDALFFDNMAQRFSDFIVISEADRKKVTTKTADAIGRNYKRNGSLARAGNVYRASDRIIDRMSCDAMRSDSLETWTEFDRFVLESIVQKTDETFHFNDKSDEGLFKSFISDGIGRGYKRNGTLLRGKTAYRASDRIADPFSMNGSTAEIFDSWTADDFFGCGQRHWFYRVGNYYRDSSIVRKSGVLEAI